MKCCSCKGNIAAGVEAQKRIVEHQQPDGTLIIFGYMMQAGPVAKATGRIVRAWHHKCYWIVRKREHRGDAVTGRVLPGVPTGYDNAVDTETISAEIDKLREVAARLGKAVGDPTVTEAFRAEAHGGPYPHTHQFRLDTYQLLAHLTYAHGLDPHSLSGSAHVNHDALHVQMALNRITDDRAQDPGHIEPPHRDWRDQVAADITELG